jgi:hypothetical protein
MFLLNTILTWSINIIMNKKYDNNNIIIASRAYFLHGADPQEWVKEADVFLWRPAPSTLFLGGWPTTTVPL